MDGHAIMFVILGIAVIFLEAWQRCSGHWSFCHEEKLRHPGLSGVACCNDDERCTTSAAGRSRLPESGQELAAGATASHACASILDQPQDTQASS